MFETSQDVLFMILSGCAVIITVLVAWLIIYLTLIIKRAYQVVHMAEKLVEKIDIYISKPISAVSGIVDQLSPIIKFFAKRKKD